MFPIKQPMLVHHSQPIAQLSHLLPRFGLLLLCLMGLFSLTLPVLAANPGDLDPGFGTGGVVTTTIGSQAYGRAMVLQPDGKIVVVGSSIIDSKSTIALVRYNSNGTVDSTFGSSGIVTTAISSNISGEAATIQPNGKIVVGGSNVLARYNNDGSLDSDFGSSGIITYNHIFGSGIALQSDNKIVISGYSLVGSKYVVALTRYNNNGSLDNTFGNSGIVTTSIGSDASSEAVAIQFDDKIIVAGDSNNGIEASFALVRYTITGTLDSTFGSSGIVTTPIGSDAEGQAVALQPDGKIVVAGYGGNPLTFALARYDKSGNLDITFGGSGVVATPIGISAYGEAVVVQSNGKIIAAGASFNGAQNMFTLARFESNGNLDSEFGSGGIVTTSIGSTAEGLALAIQSGGQIVIAGQSRSGFRTDFALARYLGDEPNSVHHVYLPVVLKQ